MKKILFVLFGLFAYTTSAHAVLTPGISQILCANNAPAVCGDGYTHGSGCSIVLNLGQTDTGYCSGCPDVVGELTTGIKITTTREKQITCNDSSKTFNCGCKITGITYSCAEGYSGTCTNPRDSSTCNCAQFECPANATCFDENNVACNDGYYLTQEFSITETTYKCNTCPENAVCTGNTVHCNPGYYKTGRGSTIGATYKCSSCPEGTTSPVSATSISQCYIPMGTNFEDLSGSGAYVADCYSE